MESDTRIAVSSAGVSSEKRRLRRLLIKCLPTQVETEARECPRKPDTNHVIGVAYHLQKKFRKLKRKEKLIAKDLLFLIAQLRRQLCIK